MNTGILRSYLLGCFAFFVLFSLHRSAFADGITAANLNMRGQAPVAVIDYLTAVTNQSYSVTSKTNTPGFRQSVCVEAYRASTIAGMSDIQAGTVTVTATLKNESALDEALLEWYINDVKMPTRGRTYPFSAVGRSIGKYKVEAKLNETAKSVNIYVVNCSYIIAVQDTSSHVPFDVSIGSIITNNFVGHASWKLQIEPAAASSARPFNTTNPLVNDYVGFHANDNVSVATTGTSVSPTPTFNNPDAITPSKTKEFPVEIPILYSMINSTIYNIAHSGNYILGTKGRAENLTTGTVYFDWSYSASRNCVTTTLEMGRSHGLSSALSYISTNSTWSDYYYILNQIIFVEYVGDAPCWLNATL